MSFRIGREKEPPKEVKIEVKKETKKEDPFKKIEQSLEKIGVLNLLESKMKISKIKIIVFLGVLILYSIMTLINFNGEYLSNLLAFLYPSYQSLKAIDEGEKGNYKQWLSFW